MVGFKFREIKILSGNKREKKKHRSPYMQGVQRRTFVGFSNRFGLMLKVPVNNFSVMLGRSHRVLGNTSTFVSSPEPKAHW